MFVGCLGLVDLHLAVKMALRLVVEDVLLVPDDLLAFFVFVFVDGRRRGHRANNNNTRSGTASLS